MSKKNSFLTSSKETITLFTMLTIIKTLISKYGRPYGGTCWFIKKQIQLISYENMDPEDQRFSKIRIIDIDNDFIDITGVWLVCDENSSDTLCTFQSTISFIAGHLKSTNHRNNIIIGDFNASFERNNRFDRIFREFVSKQRLTYCHKLTKHSEFTTYSKGGFNSRIDHCLIDLSLTNRLLNLNILIRNDDTSDHKPIQIELDYLFQPTTFQANYSNQFNSFSKHKFNWKNADFKYKYINISTSSIPHQFTEFIFDEAQSLVENVDKNLDKLNKIFLKSSRLAESESLSKNKKVSVKKIMIKKDPQICAIIRNIDHLIEQSTDNSISHTEKLNKMKKLKTNLRRIQRQKLFSDGIKQSIKLEDHLDKDNEKFWQTIKNHRQISRPSATSSNGLDMV